MARRSSIPSVVLGAGETTAKDVVAGLLVTSILASITIVVGTIIAAALCALGGLLWFLSTFSYTPKRTNAAPSSYRVARRYLVPGRFVPTLRRSAVGFLLAGVGIATLTGIFAAYSDHESKVADRARSIKDSENLNATAVGIQKLGGSLEDMKDILSDLARDLTDPMKQASALSAEGPGLADATDLYQAVRSEVERLARQELEDGSAPEDVVAEIRAGGIPTIFREIDRRVAEAEADHVQDATAARERLIEAHRARAIIGVSLGESEKAEQSLRRILDIAPDDIDALTRIGLLHTSKGRWDEAERAHKHVLDVSELAEARAAALGNLGSLALQQHRLADAEHHLQDALEAYRQIGQQDGEARQLSNLAAVEIRRGNLDLAHSLANDALRIQRRLNLTLDMIRSISNLYYVESTRGNFAEAALHAGEALELSENAGWGEGIARQLIALAGLELRTGSLEQAERHAVRALGVSEALNRPDLTAQSHAALGRVLLTRGDLSRAVEQISLARAGFRDLGERLYEADQLSNLGAVAWKQRDLKTAADRFLEAAEIYESVESKLGLARITGNLAAVERARGNLTLSEQHASKALALHRESGDSIGIALQLSNLGHIARMRGDLDRAESLHTESLAIERQMHRTEGTGNQLSNLAMVDVARGDTSRACSRWTEAVELFERAGMVAAAAETRRLANAFNCHP